MSLPFEHTQIIRSILGTLLEEHLGLSQLQLVRAMCNAIMWSQETEKIAIVFGNLVTEIVHRNNLDWTTQQETPRWLRQIPAPPRIYRPKPDRTLVDWEVFEKDFRSLESGMEYLRRARAARVRNFYGLIEPWGA